MDPAGVNNVMGLNIPRNEQGLIRVFSISRPPEELTNEIEENGKSSVAASLLGRDLPEGEFELFAMSDLSGVGLSGYLAEGYAVPAEQIAQHRRKLDALDGYVLLIFSKAFNGEEVILTPGPDLTLIGTFGEAQPDMRSTPIDSEAAQAYSGTPRQTPATPPKGASGSALVVIGVVVLLGLVLWGLLG
ncbi:hypothetical protein H9Q16_10965 [Sulfitobacter sp. TSTF-M16]|uniref:Aspartate carbamoyltransferase catalytic subunit n=3 Tax=Sulfitobacter aestuariivivens TaxID=2766981 RepID=A0A927D3P2_9RHOB|nr:hypothetical protein [Sulfitobacter aestuariivivens]